MNGNEHQGYHKIAPVSIKKRQAPGSCKILLKVSFHLDLTILPEILIILPLTSLKFCRCSSGLMQLPRNQKNTKTAS